MAGAFVLAAFAATALTPVSSQAAAAPARAAACTRLQGLAVPASAIGGPTGGATVTGAKIVAPTPGGGQGAAALPRPEFCEVTGAIAPVDPQAPPIRFQVSLPTDWNGKAIHMGGGGYNGNVVTGLNAAPRAPDTLALPITRGFATFGSDSGHEGNDAAFAVNAEAMENFAGAQLKKTRDVAQTVIRAFYGRAPARTYFVGQSQGGREGLTVAQRWPQDYDGVVVTAPALNVGEAFFRFNDIGTALARPGGFLPPAKVKLFVDAAMAHCDANDGVVDGLVGNYLGCQFDPGVLRCPEGFDSGDNCLSDAQLASVASIYEPRVWRDGSRNVIARYPRFLIGGGEDSPGGLPQWIFGRNAPPRSQPAGGAYTMQALGVGTAAFYGNSAIRYFIAKDGAFNTYDFDAAQHAERFAQVTRQLASDNADLSGFKARGGKLIMLHNTADAAITPVRSMNYYDEVVTRLGRTETEAFMRLYVVPGGDHGGLGAPSKVDLIGMLDRWVVEGRAPGDDWVAEEYGPQRTVVRTKPLCAYPYYPHYVGGDAKAAGSYRCVVSRP
jgi:hypothetical protein